MCWAYPFLLWWIGEGVYLIFYYSTGVQIVSCTLSSDSVLSESTRLLNPVLSVSANEISFDKKLANQIVSFNWCYAWKNNILHLHLVTSTGFFKCLHGVLFKLWHLNMMYFLMALICPKNVNLYNWFAGKSKLNAVSTSQSKSKLTWFPGCLMPIGTIQHLNTQILTNSTLLVASLVYGEWRWKPQQNLLNFVFALYVC